MIDILHMIVVADLIADLHLVDDDSPVDEVDDDEVQVVGNIFIFYNENMRTLDRNKKEKDR